MNPISMLPVCLQCLKSSLRGFPQIIPLFRRSLVFCSLCSFSLHLYLPFSHILCARPTYFHSSVVAHKIHCCMNTRVILVFRKTLCVWPKYFSPSVAPHRVHWKWHDTIVAFNSMHKSMPQYGVSTFWQVCFSARAHLCFDLPYIQEKIM